MPKKTQFVPKMDKSKGRYYFRFGGRKHDLGRDYWDALRRIADIAGDKVRGGAQPLTVSEAIEEYLTTQRNPQWPSGLLKSFAKFSTGLELKSLPDDHLIRFAASLKSNSPQTVRHKVRLAKAVLQHAIRQKWMVAMPEAPKLRTPSRKARDIAPDVLAATWTELPSRARPVFEFILATGCRPSEATNLMWSEVDWTRGVIVKEEHKLRHRGMERVIYLTDRAVGILRSVTRCQASPYVFLNRFHKPYKWNGLRTILRRASGEKISSVYSLRHTFAQRALDSGVSIEDLAGLLGHAKISTTQVYAQVREDRLRAVAKKLG